MSESERLKEISVSKSICRYAPYEPEATQLVMLIQVGNDEKENKKKLAEKLEPFVKDIAKKAMGCFYSKEEVEDAAQEMIDKHLLSEEEGYLGKNNHSYQHYIYKYDPLYVYRNDPEFMYKYNLKNGYEYYISDQNCFCGFLRAVLFSQFKEWRRKLPDLIPVELIVNDDETGERKKTTEYIQQTISIDEIESDDDGNEYEISPAEIQGSIQKEKEERSRTSYQDAMKELFEEVVFIYRDYFDYVNSLDESSTKQKAIDERGILAYHMKFAITKFSLKKFGIDKNEKKKKLDNYEKIDDYEKMLLKRPTSFRGALLETLLASLSEVVAYQNRDYQLVFLNDKKVEFLSRLKNRINRKGIADEIFFFLEADIKNQVYGWVNTIEKRVKNEYDAIPGKLREARRKVFNEIL